MAAWPLAARAQQTGQIARIAFLSAGTCFGRPAFPLVSALGSANSAADRSALFAGFAATMTESDFSCPCIIGYGSSPSRCGPPYLAHTRQRRPDRRYPRFRYDPFARDVALDPGRASAPRMAMPHMLPSSECKLSAPAMSDLTRLSPT